MRRLQVVLVLGGVLVGGIAVATRDSHAATRERAVAETVLGSARERLSVGSSHACEVNGDGTVRCWGSNNKGQLGDGTTTSRSTPATVVGAINVVAVASGVFHTCALQAGGTVLCWGDNSLGQLGDGTITDHLTPVPVPGISNVVAITVGDFHTCALTVSGFACWGNNSSGQLGDGSTLIRRVPVFHPGGTLNLVAIAAGSSHTCALTAFGQVFCWGGNASGQLGDGTTIDRLGLTVVAGGTLMSVVSLTAGSNHTCAIVSDGSARCWGENGFGQLGDGTTRNRSTPVPVSSLTGAVAMAGASNHTCALTADGGARCWGYNFTGDLGDGTNTDRRVPVPVSGLAGAVAISAGTVSDVTGFSETCAIVADGSARCWGDNGFGQLGDGTTTGRRTPVTVQGGGGSVSAVGIASGSSHTCAVRADSSVTCWGDNSSGQLGDGTSTNRLVPTRVLGLSGAVAVTAGSVHTCALLADGSARCWGANGSGQLGDGTVTGRDRPASVVGLTNAVAIAAGNFHTCALRSDGTVRCWGANAQGQLGDGTTTARLTPVAASGLAFASALAVGGEHSCAMLNGTGRCWGAGASGQNGDVNLLNRRTPLGVPFFDAIAVSAGDLHTCALKAGGGASCWGANATAQLGFTTMFGAPTATPFAVSNLAGATRLGAGAGHTCAVLADGSVSCWGDNSRGQIGDGTTTQRGAPTPVTTLKVVFFGRFPVLTPVPLPNIVQVAAGRRHTCIAIANGSVLCWGENAFGQLGDGTTADKPSPGSSLSFSLNIDPLVRLEGGGRVSTVEILAACDPGQRVQVDVTLTQGSVTGQGVGTAECDGGLARFPVMVPAQGPDPFLDTTAMVTAVGVIRERGAIAETQEWTRAVVIAGEL